LSLKCAKNVTVNRYRKLRYPTTEGLEPDLAARTIADMRTWNCGSSCHTVLPADLDRIRQNGYISDGKISESFKHKVHTLLFVKGRANIGKKGFNPHKSTP
jgi:hypothetical protein